MSNWDDEDFEPTVAVNQIPEIQQKSWDDEDADEDVESWEQKLEEKQKPKEQTTPTPTPTATATQSQRQRESTTKPHAKGNEKADAKPKKVPKGKPISTTSKNFEKLIVVTAIPTETPTTPAVPADERLTDLIAEKLRQQHLVEESDYENTKDLFSDIPETSGDSNKAPVLDDFHPITEQDFTKFASLLAAKICPHLKGRLSLHLLKELLTQISVDLSPEDLNELSKTINIIKNDKLQKEKEKDKKKKKGASAKKSLNKREDIFDDFTTSDDYEMFA